MVDQLLFRAFLFFPNVKIGVGPIGIKRRGWEKDIVPVMHPLLMSMKKCGAAVPKLFGIRDWFCERQFFHGLGGGMGSHAA